MDKKMNITILCPREEFDQNLRQRLSSIGQVSFTKSRKEYSLSELKHICQGTQILGVDPDNLGGWEKVSSNLQKLIEKLPSLKGIALSTTAFHHVNLEYCRKNEILVTYVPGYSSESIAEHRLGLLLGLMKRFFVTHRILEKGGDEFVMGYELRGKTLGIIGLGDIGQKMADLANGIGMNVIAFNRTEKKYPGVKLLSIDEVLAQADAISLHLATNEQTTHFLNQERILKMKQGAFVVNTADRNLIDEVAMADALSSGCIDSYALEAEEFNGPLAALENMFFFKGFGWYTQEALQENKRMWAENIEALAKKKTVNPVPTQDLDK